MTNGTTEKKRIQSIVPAANIVETPTSYVVTLDIPGAVKENIKANIEQSSLMISADIRDPLSADRLDRIEKEYRREFALANNIDLNSVDAQYEHGVLTVTLNKKQQYLPKHITIN